ncbi:LOW QUALITY PROTEIN: centrosomal protein of 55 kDa [Pristis pectinata]|uniref:LOW QUALITY PROTEIN: centrosomal protein of 55 kDa n=1 Tax=Pristis pectinata TaxID=685728 RepID=UPI00223D8625|nr:LOW QUALITY PROTEIN: centrosomal protein of 55 kDa [Pristis pectinata]
MTSKSIISSRFGFGKVAVSKSDGEAEKLRKENALLKRSLEELSKGRTWERERNRLLEKILALETTKQKQIQELEQKDKQILTMKDRLPKSGGNDVTTLCNQLAEKTKDAKRKEQLFKSLSEETENLKSELSAITLKCKELESNVPTLQPPSQTASHDFGTVQAQLKDALEKNQQWLVYDQQREAYVRGLLARIFELEQETRKYCETNTANELSEDKQKHYDQLLSTAKKDFEEQHEIAEGLKSELSEMRKRYEEKNLEVKAISIKLQAEQGCNKWKADEERKCSAEKMQRLQTDLETLKAQYEEEKKRSADLLYQIQLLQRSSINQQEEQSRNRIMEQQMQNISSDFENEKHERQNLQHQLHKVLKELRKAREQIARLENTQVEDNRLLEPVLNKSGEDQEKSRVPRSRNHLDESFLECPKCKAQYPTSRHRDLLEHVDICNY